jgi:AbrB family looped-hinge helix DNA binding protein
MFIVMYTQTTITPKFQVHIPVSIRRKIGLKKHGRAIIKAKDRKIIIEPVDEKKGILSLAGKFKVKKPIPAEKIRDYIDYSWGKR